MNTDIFFLSKEKSGEGGCPFSLQPRFRRPCRSGGGSSDGGSYKRRGLVVQGRAWPYDALSRHTLWQKYFLKSYLHLCFQTFQIYLQRLCIFDKKSIDSETQFKNEFDLIVVYSGLYCAWEHAVCMKKKMRKRGVTMTIACHLIIKQVKFSTYCSKNSSKLPIYYHLFQRVLSGEVLRTRESDG